MSQVFRELLKKVGSGAHTSEPLTRAEAEAATRMILQQEATPIQIGAFLIAHRIKRPTGTELAGMLDAYDALGPKVAAIGTKFPVTVFCVPYDGRSRTAPILPLTALVLATAGCPVLMHGGDRMATKYGVPLIDLWQGLGVNWSGVSLEHVQRILAEVNLGFLYTSEHFPLLQPLVIARDQLGKRPPFATLELLWCPYAGDAHLIAGYVHPPTEAMMQEAFRLRGRHSYTTVKGLEGSCDLPRDRTAIIGAERGDDELERILLNSRDVHLNGHEVPYCTLKAWAVEAQQVLKGQKTNALYAATLWNSGFYLWHLGRSPTLRAGLDLAALLLQEHQVADCLATVQRCVTHVPSVGMSL
jgi:anthranilate phosphoribosyltransferase